MAATMRGGRPPRHRPTSTPSPRSCAPATPPPTSTAARASPDFPTPVTRRYDWRGYDPGTHTASWLPAAQHPHTTDQDYLVSWNNKQAPGWAAADDKWDFGAVFRSQMIEDRIKAGIAGGRKLTISQLVQAMDEPATEDLRAVKLL